LVGLFQTQQTQAASHVPPPLNHSQPHILRTHNSSTTHTHTSPQTYSPTTVVPSCRPTSTTPFSGSLQLSRMARPLMSALPTTASSHATSTILVAQVSMATIFSTTIAATTSSITLHSAGYGSTPL